MRWLAVICFTPLGCGQPATDEPAPPTPTPKPAHIVDAQVRWPSPGELDRDALRSLTPAAAAVAGRSPVPALVVKRDALLERAMLMAKPKWYALTTSADGVTVSIHATQTAHRYAHVPSARGTHAVRGQAAFVTQNESIWSAAWIEGGVAYSLELECDSLPDSRCADATHVMALAKDLAYVGGVGR